MFHKRNPFIIGVLLNLLCYMVFSPLTVQAASPPPGKSPSGAPLGLQPIVTNGSGNTFFDRETVRYIKDPYKDAFILEVWIKTDDGNPLAGHNFAKYYIRLEPRQYQQIKSIDYDGDSKIIEQSTFIYSETRWKEIIPESMADSWYHQILKFATDSKLIGKPTNSSGRKKP